MRFGSSNVQTFHVGILTISGMLADLVNRFPEFVAKNDHVLMAIAKTFPSGLDDWETLMYPCKF
jgi:hypothetical protein